MNNPLKLIDQHKCPTCGNFIRRGEFRDVLSLKEFRISGMCQTCQDSVFEEDERREDG
jgi:endogenous inhibitor of DNA gyrase (YacG/DUF329 family)